jgi:hypothetical protein
MNLFSANDSRFKSGLKDLNVWPFYEIDERLGCMKEYNGMKHSDSIKVHNDHSLLHQFFTKLNLQFETFMFPLVYTSRDEKEI